MLKSKTVHPGDSALDQENGDSAFSESGTETGDCDFSESGTETGDCAFSESGSETGDSVLSESGKETGETVVSKTELRYYYLLPLDVNLKLPSFEVNLRSILLHYVSSRYACRLSALPSSDLLCLHTSVDRITSLHQDEVMYILSSH